VYIAGNTSGNLGGTAPGTEDAIVAKYSAGGTLRWTQLLGTRTLDIARGITVDPSGTGNFYGSDGTRTRDLRRDRLVPRMRRLATIDALSLYSCGSAGPPC
jgi:hypothetical protein